MRIKGKRLVAFASAVAMLASTITGVSANSLHAWGETSIAIGSDFCIVTKSDGTCYISNSNYDNVNFKRNFSTGETVKVAVPKEVMLDQTYALILKENGAVKGYNFNSNDLTAHKEQIDSVKVASGAVDIKAIDDKAVVLLEDGTIRFNKNTERGSENISYYIDVNEDGIIQTEIVNETVYAPAEEALEWTDIKAIDLEEDYILGVTDTGEVKMSNSEEMTGELNTYEISYDKQTVDWSNNWNASDFADEMGSVKEEVELLTDVKYADGTQNFVVYVKNDGTCGMIGGDIYGFSDEIESWTDVNIIKAYAESTKALVVGVKNDGSIVTTTYGASAIVEGNEDEQLEELNSISDAEDVEIHRYGNTYNIVVKHKNLTYTNIYVGNETDWLEETIGNSFDATLPIDYAIVFDGNIRKVAFSLSEEYTEGYKLYIKEKKDGEELVVDSIYEYKEPLEINKNTEYEYIITKEVNGEEVASSVYTKSVTIQDNEPTIVASVDSGVVNSGTKVSLDVQFNGVDLDGFDIKYIKATHQNNNIINKIKGKTIDELRDSNDLDVLMIVANTNIIDYESEIEIKDNCDLFVWSVDKNNGNNVNSTINHLRYTTLMSRPNVYPTEEYKSVYSEQEMNDISNGYRVLRRNTMVVKSGSYMSAALATNGEVWSNKISTVNNKDMDIPTRYVQDVPYSETSTDWLATRMWRMISDIAVGESHVAGLKLDGTVIASGNNEKNQCDVSDWTDIVDIAAGKDHTVGLKKTGEVIGTTSLQGNTEDYGQTEFGTWMYKYDDSLSEEENKRLEKENRIIAIEANNNNTIGLRNNGTVVVAGNNDSGQCNTDTWTNVIDIAMGTRHAVGLKSDGTVVATGDNGYGQCEVGGWTDIVQISASAYETVGITYDGRIVSTGNSYEGTVALYGSQTELCRLQPALLDYIGDYNQETKNFEATQSYKTTHHMNIKSGDDYIKSSFYNEANRINVYNTLNKMHSNGIKFKYVSSGNYVTIAIDEEGIVYNVIHSAGPDNPDDGGYPIIMIDNENYSTVLDRGPTIINNYSSGYYNKELEIKLGSTTGEENNILWSLDNTDVYAMGTNSTSLTFEGAEILNVAPYSLIGTHKINYPEIKYLYMLGAPEIIFSKQGLVDKGTQLIITSTRPQKYALYYTTDGTEPGFEMEDTDVFVPNSSTKEYTGAITIDESVKITAKAFDKDYIQKSPTTNASKVYEVDLIVSGGELGTTGTIIEDSFINKDTIFTRQGSPYTIVNNLTVVSGSTLSIEPGVTVNVMDNKSITVNGNIVSYGTKDEPVMFTSDGKWGGLKVNSQSGNNGSVLQFIDISNASTALSINTETTRLVGGIKNISIHNNDSGLSVQSEDMVVSQVKSYDNKNGFGIAMNGNNITVDNCVVTGNSIGISVNGLNSSITNSCIENNMSYGVFLDGGVDSIFNGLIVNDNIIKDNYSLNNETGEKLGYNIGYSEDTWVNQTTLNLRNNYWGLTKSKDINETITKSEKSIIFLIDGFKEIPKYCDDLSIVTENIDSSNRELKVTVKRIGGTASVVPIIIVGYDNTGAVMKTEIINDLIAVDDTGVYYTDMGNASNVRVFIWESLNSIQPII